MTKKRSEMTRKEFRELEPRAAYITKKGRLAWKRTRKQIWEDTFWTVVQWIVFPFYWVWRGIQKVFNWILWERIRTGDNGIMGPGYHVYYTTRFAWGKLTFFIVVLFIIAVVIYELWLKH
jgi:hypothetical protein